MNFKKIIFVLFLIFSLLPINKIFAQNTNTGFVSGNIWYSKEKFEEGDKIKIHTFVFNPDTRELSGNVIFFDKITLLGKKSFIIPPNTARDVSIDWTVTAGDHTIFGKIENAKFLISKDKYEDTYIAENETEKSSFSISKKIEVKKDSEDNTKNDFTLIQDIGDKIVEKTPKFITQPINSTLDKVEEIREDMGSSSKDKKEEIKKEIESLDSKKDTSQKPEEKNNPLLKPFKYVELFFLTISSFILNSKIVFYTTLIVIIFFILRLIWSKIF